MRQKVALFLVFLMVLFFLSVGVRAAGANGPPKMVKTTELEAKLAKVEAGLEQMKSELGQVEKGLTEMKEGLGKIQKKMVSDEEAAKKQIPDNQKSLNLFWLIIIAIVIVMASVVIFIFSVIYKAS